MKLRKINSNKRMNKKAISEMVGYVLLIVIAIIISGFTYQWLKTYIPKEEVKCDEGTTLRIIDAHCNDDGLLNITLRNNGKFGVGGYSIYVSDTPKAKIAEVNIAGKFKEGTNQELFGSLADEASVVIKFTGIDYNSFAPGKQNWTTFEISKSTNINTIASCSNIKVIEITPIRFQEANNKMNLAMCDTIARYELP